MINLAMRGRIESGTPLMNFFQSRLCTPSALRCGLCGTSLFFSYGYDGQQMNYVRIKYKYLKRIHVNFYYEQCLSLLYSRQIYQTSCPNFQTLNL